jgi:membrane protein
MSAGIGATGQEPRRESRGLDKERRDQILSLLRDLRRRIAPLIALWSKINNDWIFNWSAALAYTLLTSIIPIFLVILAIGGFILGAISPLSLAALERILASGLPGGAEGAGGQIVNAALHQLNQSAGAYLLIGIVGAIIAGSGLFLSLESVFGIVFRLKNRDVIPQRIMAISMVLFYVLLVPIVAVASIAPGALRTALHISQQDEGGNFLMQVLGLLIAFAAAYLFFGGIYFVIPNRRMKLGEIWMGTLISAVLLLLYELAFPIYSSLFLRDNYGSIVGVVIVFLIFFYYLAFILMLGAEVISMTLGLRPTTKPLGAVLQELQAHDIMIESEEEVSGKSVGASRPSDAGLGLDPSSVEASHAPARAASPGLSPISPRLVEEIPDGTCTEKSGMTRRQRRTLGAVLVTGAIACVPVARLVRHLLLDED